MVKLHCLAAVCYGAKVMVRLRTKSSRAKNTDRTEFLSHSEGCNIRL